MDIKENVKMVTFRSRKGWLDNRSGIGGSDAAAILGLSPWTTNIDLFNYKTGQDTKKDISKNEAVKFGHDAEASIRRLFALDHPEYKVSYKANNSWSNTKYPWMMGSLDGWLKDQDGRFGVLEIKTTEILKDRDWTKWDNHIPEQYFIQLLHYMIITEADFSCLRAYIKYHKQEEKRVAIRDYRLERAEVLDDIKYLTEREENFWECVKNKKQPPLILIP